MRKRVLITGGARGLGKEIACEFARHEYDVTITYLKSEDKAKELVLFLKDEYRIDVDCIKVDLEDESVIESLTSKIPKIDVLINNAAYNNDGDLLSKTASDFKKTIQVNLIAPFILSKVFYPILKKNRGSIVNIASTNGIDTMYPESVDYDASKAGLINMTKNLASAFGPRVRVNAVAPGWIDTHNTKDMNPLFRRQEEAKIVAERFATPSEIAKVVYFVASSEASYMNGSIVRIDGGMKYGNR